MRWLRPVAASSGNKLQIAVCTAGISDDRRHLFRIGQLGPLTQPPSSVQIVDLHRASHRSYSSRGDEPRLDAEWVTC
jgi:hypothetical protein